MSRRNSPEDVFRFIDTCDNDPEPCWPWTGYIDKNNPRGYFSVAGVRRLAYQIVYELVKGNIPEGMVVRHKCDNPRCCNPTHLELGTHGDNEDDKYEHDRWGYTDDMLLEIRRLGKLKMSTRRIAQEVSKKFECEISHSGVHKVLTGQTRDSKRMLDNDKREERKQRRIRKGTGGTQVDS